MSTRLLLLLLVLLLVVEHVSEETFERCDANCVQEA